MCDNRTSEFLALAQGLPVTDRLSSLPSRRLDTIATSSQQQQQQQQQQAAAGSKSKNTNPAYQELRNFHQTAAGISRDIASTSALLTELTERVRHGGDPARMNQLVVRIKTSIENLNSRLDQASRQIQQQKRRVGQQAGEEAANMVDGLQTVFAEAASDFKKVLQQRTESMKEQTDFVKQVYNKDDDDDDPIPNMSLGAPPPVYSGTPNGSFPTLDLTSSFMSPGEPTSSLPRPHGISYGTGAAGMRQRHLNHTYSSSSYGSYGAPPLTPLDIQRQEEEMGLQMQLIPDQDYLQQRADAMSQVETNIVELGAIFNKLAVMVSEHRDLVQRVDDNVQDANTNINLSMSVLTDTLTNLRSNRMLALRVFSVLVLFIIAFIIFFA